MTPKVVLQNWIAAFNAADAEKLSALYHQDAINHQVANPREHFLRWRMGNS